MAEVPLPHGGHFNVSWGTGTELRLAGVHSRAEPLGVGPSATASSVQWCVPPPMPSPRRPSLLSFKGLCLLPDAPARASVPPVPSPEAGP